MPYGDEMTSTSYQDHCWFRCSTDLGGGGGGAGDFLGLFGDRHSSSDDLFELVWRGSGGGGGRGDGSMERQPSCKPLSSRRRFEDKVVPVPERLGLAVAPPPPRSAAAPSEAEMASWLFPIVCGEELAAGGDGAVVAGGPCALVDDDQIVPSGKKSSDQKLQKRKTSSTEGKRSHHHAEAHSLTEKRRRLKIKEKFRTLQQLVPGCDNNNQASTLDQTIRYMKSLQHHIQAMSFRCGMKPTSVAAVYPVVQQAPCLACWQQVGMHIVAGMPLGRSPAIIPFCPHVSMGSPPHHPADMPKGRRDGPKLKTMPVSVDTMGCIRN